MSIQSDAPSSFMAGAPVLRNSAAVAKTMNVPGSYEAERTAMP